MAERDRLLLVDNSDKRISELDAAADGRRLTLERVDEVEPLLLAELQELTHGGEAAPWAALRERYDAAALDYATALCASPREDAKLMGAIDDEACSAEVRARE